MTENSSKPSATQKISIPAFSLLINLLYLTGPIFMLQVYDRVLTSASIPTLIGLFAIVILLFAFFGLLDFIRMQVLLTQGERTSAVLAEKGYGLAIANACGRLPPGPHLTAMDDVTAYRQFMTSPTRAALHDLPWAPLFLAFVFSLHMGLGILALGAGVMLACLAIVNERSSRGRIADSTDLSLKARNQSAIAARNADLLVGNGMVRDIKQRWRVDDHTARQNSLKAGKVTFGFTTLTKALRLAIQSLILAVGAYYVIQGELTAGGMIAGSIVFSRAIAPLEQVLGNYAMVSRARTALKNIKTWEHLDLDPETRVSLPAPSEQLTVENVSVTVPGTDALLLDDISFSLKAGDVLGIIGASGSGKSTLVRALVGAWPLSSGTIRLDGAELSQWSPGEIGKHVGYLPQTIDLLPGTISENISRHQPDADFDAVIRASQMADVHELILRLPDGYNTPIGENGVVLSAGQKQRIALARALFGDPFLVVMDEPNSNLDAAGDAALNHALKALQANGKIGVVVAHRPNVLAALTQLMVMSQGRVGLFGAAKDVLASLRNKNIQAVREATR